jgi:hypothetical protein
LVIEQSNAFRSTKNQQPNTTHHSFAGNAMKILNSVIVCTMLGVNLSVSTAIFAQTTPPGVANLARYRQMFTLAPNEGLDFRPDILALSGAAVPAVHFSADGRVIVAGSGVGGRLFTATSNNGASYTPIPGMNGLSGINDGSVIYLPDGRFRYIVQELSPTHTMTRPRIRIASFISTDGLVWTKESGIRYQPGIADDSVSGVPYCLQIKDSSWRMYYAGDIMGNAARTMSPMPSFNGVRTAISNDWGVTWTSEVSRNITRNGDIDPHVVYLSDGRYRMYLRSARSAGIIAIEGTSPISFDTSRITVVLPDRSNGIVMRFDPFVVKYPNGDVICYTGTDGSAGSMTQTVVAAVSVARPTSTTFSTQANTTLLSMSLSPNPAFDFVVLHFALPKPEKVSLKLFNALGQEVAHILDETLPAGEHQKSFDVSRWSLRSGVYVVHSTTQHGARKALPVLITR